MLATSLYVHVPFCARRCVYCDFSIAVRPIVPVDEYLKAIESEWARHRQSTFDLETLYLGGGTPSKLGAEGVARLLESIRRHAHVRQNAEITLEANPEDVTCAAARAWQEAGVNRLSLGIQSFDNRALEWMHRTHNVAMALAAVSHAREAGIQNISIDLIFAFPNAVERSWARDLETALAIDVPHISIYGLTIEPRTPLGHWVGRNQVVEAPEDSFAADFMHAHDLLTSAGMEHYEVSNYGKPGYHSRHNWTYWCRKPYGGLGPSAHEFDGNTRRWNSRAYAEWRSRSSQGEDPVEGREELSGAQIEAEEIYLKLRTVAGLEISDAEQRHVAPWLQAGWAEIELSRLRLTGAGWLRLDSLATDLTAFRSRY